MPELQDLPIECLGEADELRASIGWGRGAWFMEPMMRSGGCVLAIRTPEGSLAAMGGAGRFGDAGIVCNMAVAPEMKRQGLGRQVFEGLLAWFGARGIESVQLEATEEGEPLYEQYGFQTRWESVSAVLRQSVEAGDERGIDALRDADWGAVAELDRAATAMDRSTFLRALADGPYREAGLVLREGSRVEAFGFSFPGRIGPVVAVNPAAAARLARALASRAPEGTLATVGHPMHAPFWQALGFEVEPFDVRMALGDEPADQPGMIFCMLNGALG